MNASRTVKAAGYNCLADVAAITNINSSTLGNYYKTNPEFFKVILAGCILLHPPKYLSSMIELIADDLSAATTEADLVDLYKYYRRVAQDEFGADLPKSVFLSLAREVIADHANEVQ